jgi:hypothetical protein
MIDLNMCGQEKADGSRCVKKCGTGDTMCKLHRTVADRREQTRRAAILWRDALDMLWGAQPIQQFSQLTVMIDDAFDRGWITQFYSDDLYRQLHQEWMFYRDQRIVPTAQAKTELQRLAMDNQNVHTKEVMKQTSEAQEFLLKTPIPSGQKALQEIETAWTGKDAKKVLKDMTSFYKMSDNDHLYKRLLDGLWARIQVHPEKAELIQRLWEETSEAVGKCYQGHICRLGNVMVGFTEEVKTDMPLGEILQQKMAVIAAKEVDVLHKVCEAWFVCEELKVPQEERAAWIEAL